MKAYVGDGIYMEYDPDAPIGAFILTTEDGISVQNTIYIEPETWAALQRLVTEHGNSKG